MTKIHAQIFPALFFAFLHFHASANVTQSDAEAQSAVLRANGKTIFANSVIPSVDLSSLLILLSAYKRIVGDETSSSIKKSLKNIDLKAYKSKTNVGVLLGNDGIQFRVIGRDDDVFVELLNAPKKICIKNDHYVCVSD